MNLIAWMYLTFTPAHGWSASIGIVGELEQIDLVSSLLFLDNFPNIVYIRFSTVAVGYWRYGANLQHDW